MRANLIRARTIAVAALAVVGLALAGAPAEAQEAPPPGAAPAAEAGQGEAGQGGAGQSAGAHGGHHDPSKHFNYFDFGWRKKDVVGGLHGDGVNRSPDTGATVEGAEEKMSPPFVFMLLNFAVLFALLAWKGGPVARKIAAERHDQIKSALDEAARLRKQAADKLAEYETRLKDADAEIKKLVDGMRADAEADKARILAAAAAQAAQMKKDAERRIAAEIELSRARLTREVTAAAAAATEQLLRDKMVAADHQRLIGTFITDIGADTAKPAGGAR